MKDGNHSEYETSDERTDNMAGIIARSQAISNVTIEHSVDSIGGGIGYYISCKQCHRFGSAPS